MNFSIKKLSIALVAGVIAAVGFVAPAQAALMTGFSATTTSTLAAGQVIANDIVVTFTVPTAVAQDLNNQVQVKLTNTTGYGVSSTACGANATVVSSPALTASCYTQANAGSSYVYIAKSMPGLTIGANTTFTFTIAGGTLTQTGAGPIAVTALTKGISGGVPTTFDSSTTDLAVGPANSTVSFNANNGSGAMADQSASSATALNANAFTRSGYTFAGWNTAADGSGTSYADGASYAFTSSTTLYAQWTATLATTGFNGMPYLLGGIALAAVGGALLLTARRKHSN